MWTATGEAVSESVCLCVHLPLSLSLMDQLRLLSTDVLQLQPRAVVGTISLSLCLPLTTWRRNRGPGAHLQGSHRWPK